MSFFVSLVVFANIFGIILSYQFPQQLKPQLEPQLEPNGRLEPRTEMQPNIMFMFVDDLGFNDVGWNSNSRIQTPFLDHLVKEESLILTHNYVQKLCTPSRAAFLTGRYPIRYGLQHSVLTPDETNALTQQESLISHEFQTQGYGTHMIGKWHLGFCTWEYTPNERGFDTFFGFYSGAEGYFDHESQGFVDDVSLSGYDLRENHDPVPEEVHYGVYGPHMQRDHLLEILSQYAPSKFEHKKTETKPFFIYVAWQETHSPAESLPEFYAKYEQQSLDLGFNEDFIHHQAQMTSFDSIMEEVVTYLKSNGLWDNLVLVVSSDNGGQYEAGDNAPLRGFKSTTWEGGIRVPGFVTGGLLPESRRGKMLDYNIVHVIDWYPTLLSAANLPVTYATSNKKFESMDPLDGVDMWPAIVGEDPSSNLLSRELLLDLDPYECTTGLCGSIRVGQWKYIISDTLIESQDWEPESCFWGRTYAISSSSDILHCGTSPKSYLDYGLTDENEIRDTTDMVTCLTSRCALVEGGCLFDILNDPCEYNDVSLQYPDVVEYLRERLYYYNLTQIEPLQVRDNSATVEQLDPKNHGNYWSPYLEGDMDFERFITRDYANKKQKYMAWSANNKNKIKENNVLKNYNNYNNNNPTQLILIILGAVMFLGIGYCLKRICKYNKDKQDYSSISISNVNGNANANANANALSTKQFSEHSPLIQKTNNFI